MLRAPSRAQNGSCTDARWRNTLGNALLLGNEWRCTVCTLGLEVVKTRSAGSVNELSLSRYYDAWKKSIECQCCILTLLVIDHRLHVKILNVSRSVTSIFLSRLWLIVNTLSRIYRKLKRSFASVRYSDESSTMRKNIVDKIRSERTVERIRSWNLWTGVKRENSSATVLYINKKSLFSCSITGY